MWGDDMALEIILGDGVEEIIAKLVVEKAKEIAEEIKPELEIYSLNQAVKKYGIGRKTIEQAIERGVITKYFKKGRTTYLTQDSIRELVESGVELE